MSRSGPPPPLPASDAEREASAGAEDGVQSSLFEVAPAAPMKPGHSDKSARPQDDDRAGHRRRLLEKFRMFGADHLADYELLEMLLFSVFPRGDTKPIAKRLIKQFGSLAEVITAPPERLAEIEGVGPRVVDELKVALAVAVRLQRGRIMGRKVLDTWSAVIDYCRAAQGFDAKEQFRILFLDKRNQLIADEVQQSGTVDHTPVYVREVVKRALEHSASAIILVHNHPSGDPTPSRADIDMTKMIAESARPLGISVHDHIIVGRKGHASLKALRHI